MNFYLPVLIIVVSVAAYQVAAKLAPPQLSPWHLLTLVYALAGALTLAVGLTERESLWQSLRQSTWAVWVLGAAVVGIELGYLLAYRAGWKISLTGLVAHASVALIMLPVGVWLFKEKLSTLNLLGMAFCLLGLFLVSRR